MINKINKEILKELFLKYIELQQDINYIKEENYLKMNFENIILLEEDHFKDWLKVLEDLKRCVK